MATLLGAAIGGWLLAANAAGLVAAEAEPPAEKTMKHTVAGLAWLAGTWSGTEEGVATEEHWTAPDGDAMLGMNKAVRSGRMVSFEFLRIAHDKEGRVCYFASPGGKSPPTPFCAVELTGSKVVFENLAHDFPKRILYWLDENGRLHARTEGVMDGKEVAEQWAWTKRGTP